VWEKILTYTYNHLDTLGLLAGAIVIAGFLGIIAKVYEEGCEGGEAEIHF
jgi:hypothetical protein